MSPLAIIGKKRAIICAISILLVSVYTIYAYHANKTEIDMPKLIQQIIRFVFTIILLYFLYKGKHWAKVVMLILFSLGTAIAIYYFLTIEAPFLVTLPLLVMIFVYSVSIYHFGFSKSFQAFSEFQNK